MLVVLDVFHSSPPVLRANACLIKKFCGIYLLYSFIGLQVLPKTV